MTIIEPQKNKRSINVLLLSSISLSLCAVFFSVFVYNSTINLVRASSGAHGDEQSALTRNAELKNKLYSLLDAKNLRALAEAQGLKRVANPEYLEVQAVPILATL